MSKPTVQTPDTSVEFQPPAESTNPIRPGAPRRRGGPGGTRVVPTKEGPPVSNPLGDAYALLNPAGLVWTGANWSADFTAARRYEDGPDIYAQALAACAEVGGGCFPLYLPGPLPQANGTG